MKLKMRPWHCYYHLMLGFFLLHCAIYIGGILLLKEIHFELLGLLLVEIILLTGLKGFVKKKPIYKPWFWQIATFVGFLVLCYLVYEMQLPLWIGRNSTSSIATALLVILLSPWLYGLVRYGFLDQKFWGSGSQT